MYMFLQVTSQMITSSHAYKYYCTQCKARIIFPYINFFSNFVTMRFLNHSSKFDPKAAASQH